jgi:hypothetical protein
VSTAPCTESRANIALLPPEVIEHILTFGDPVDVVSPLSQANRRLHTLISSDPHLWRTLYLLQPLDDPRTCLTPLGRPYLASPDAPFAWAARLQRIMRARAVCAKPAVARPGEFHEVLATLLDLVLHVPPCAGADAVSLNLLWVAATLSTSALLDADADALGLSAEDCALRARLHTYYGLSEDDAHSASRVASRGRVYSMRNYTFENAFGPFMPSPPASASLFGNQNMTGASGGEEDEDEQRLVVNWEHVRALHHVMSMHVVDLKEEDEFVYVLFPMSMPYCQSMIPPGLDLDTERDWAGVEGVWHVAFAFCDHRELLGSSHSFIFTLLDV